MYHFPVGISSFLCIFHTVPHALFPFDGGSRKKRANLVESAEKQKRRKFYIDFAGSLLYSGNR
jgi:hypothetical protein